MVCRVFRILVLLVFSTTFVVGNGCSSQISDAKLAEQIIKTWMRARAANSPDCNKQTKEILDAILAKYEVKEYYFNRAVDKRALDVKQWEEKYGRKYCDKFIASAMVYHKHKKNIDRRWSSLKSPDEGVGAIVEGIGVFLAIIAVIVLLITVFALKD